MSDKEKKSNKFLDKLKNVKHIEVYIAIIFIVVLLLIYLSNTQPKTSTKNAQTGQNLSVTQYVNNLETKLEEILTNIEGVTNVKVMISLDMSKAEVVDSKINLTYMWNRMWII